MRSPPPTLAALPRAVFPPAPRGRAAQGPWPGGRVRPAAGTSWPDCNSGGPSEEAGGLVGAPPHTHTHGHPAGKQLGPQREGTRPWPKPVTPAGQNPAQKSGHGDLPFGAEPWATSLRPPGQKAPPANLPWARHPSSPPAGTEAGRPSDLPVSARLGWSGARRGPSRAGPAGEEEPGDTSGLKRLPRGEGQAGTERQCPGPTHALSRCPPGLCRPLRGIPWHCPWPRPPPPAPTPHSPGSVSSETAQAHLSASQVGGRPQEEPGDTSVACTLPSELSFLLATSPGRWSGHRPPQHRAAPTTVQGSHRSVFPRAKVRPVRSASALGPPMLSASRVGEVLRESI